MKVNSCYVCGEPIPQLILDDFKFNFRCRKCSCETKGQETVEKARDLWNEGMVYPFNEKQYWDIIFNK